MLNVICILASVISVCCCIVCVIKYKNTNHDKLYYLERWRETIDEKFDVLASWDKTIKHCERIISFNESLIKCNEHLTDVNADLRLELNKMKENSNA